MTVGILPFCQLNPMTFSRDGAVQLCCTGNAGFTITYRNDNVEATISIGGCVFAMLATNHDAVFLQTHVLYIIRLLC